MGCTGGWDRRPSDPTLCVAGAAARLDPLAQARSSGGIWCWEPAPSVRGFSSPRNHFDDLVRQTGRISHISRSDYWCRHQFGLIGRPVLIGDRPPTAYDIVNYFHQIGSMGLSVSLSGSWRGPQRIRCPAYNSGGLGNQERRPRKRARQARHPLCWRSATAPLQKCLRYTYLVPICVDKGEEIVEESSLLPHCPPWKRYGSTD